MLGSIRLSGDGEPPIPLADREFAVGKAHLEYSAKMIWILKTKRFEVRKGRFFGCLAGIVTLAQRCGPAVLLFGRGISISFHTTTVRHTQDDFTFVAKLKLISSASNCLFTLR